MLKVRITLIPHDSSLLDLSPVDGWSREMPVCRLSTSERVLSLASWDELLQVACSATRFNSPSEKTRAPTARSTGRMRASPPHRKARAFVDKFLQHRHMPDGRSIVRSSYGTRPSAEGNQQSKVTGRESAPIISMMYWRDEPSARE